MKLSTLLFISICCSYIFASQTTSEEEIFNHKELTDENTIQAPDNPIPTCANDPEMNEQASDPSSSVLPSVPSDSRPLTSTEKILVCIFGLVGIGVLIWNIIMNIHSWIVAA